MFLLAQAVDKAPTITESDWGQLAFLVLAAFVMILQLVNSLLNSRNNKEVIKKSDQNYDNLEKLIKEKYTAIDNIYRERTGQLHDDLIVLTTNVTNLVRHVETLDERMEKVDKAIDLRDEEGRRRIYTPNNHDAMQNKMLDLLAGLVQSQKMTVSQLESLNSKTDQQVLQCQAHMLEIRKAPTNEN